MLFLWCHVVCCFCGIMPFVVSVVSLFYFVSVMSFVLFCFCGVMPSVVSAGLTPFVVSMVSCCSLFLWCYALCCFCRSHALCCFYAVMLFVVSAVADLLWRAPELLQDTAPSRGTQEGDVYAFAIIMFEIYGRRGPYGDITLSPKGRG